MTPASRNILPIRDSPSFTWYTGKRLKQRQEKPQYQGILGEVAYGLCDYLKFAYKILSSGASSDGS